MLPGGAKWSQSPINARSRQRAKDVVIDEFAQLLRSDAALHVGVKDLEKVLEPFAFRLIAELLVPEQSFPILLQVRAADASRAAEILGEQPPSAALSAEPWPDEAGGDGQG